MRPIRPIELSEIVGGSVESLGTSPISGFALDSRQVRPGDLFIAIVGENVDGHDFAPQALAGGAVAVLADRPIEGPHILVPDVVKALAQMALHFREAFRGPVVGVTGSVGKTTCKELVAAALKPLGKVAKTEGNRNTELTAPLLWAELDGDERAVVVEMGMRGFGQIAHLAAFSQPTIGVITNVGVSHIELVGSRQGIAEAKAELFEALPTDGLAVAWSGDDFLGILRAQAPCPVATFGFGAGSDCRIVGYTANSWTDALAVFEVGEERVEVRLPAVGRHIALSAAAALLVARHAGVDLEAAADAIAEAKLPGGRMEVIQRDGVTVVMDAYNAAPASFKAALEALAEIPCAGSRLVVMGEMRELGGLAEEAHREVGRMIAAVKPARACFFGGLTRFAAESCSAAGMEEHQLTQAEDIDVVRRFVASAMPGDTVLIKGSRAMELERVVASKEAKVQNR
ncbi:MAG: UDP-N-acetylmuramoyl-tripeptide--D-alanyl-D-alanine ligase [Armatimonadetes bacterium]|nr:UDP-N-acetylmuramoyl-tripeptide--D-alanyl-D-alanine ligase [Armatimonadota bacterium]